MLFHEVYGSYYNAVAEILSLAVEGKLDRKGLKAVCDNLAFSESFITISSALENEKWQILKKDFTTPIKHKPQMPLTNLQKRWLKAISLDPRIRLFNLNFDFLNEVKPLFTPDDFVLFDKCDDGDDYENESYIKNFRMLLFAIKSKRTVSISYNSPKSGKKHMTGMPLKMEYSEKDDKFRVYLAGKSDIGVINLSRITGCRLTNKPIEIRHRKKSGFDKYFVLELVDERNALERAMLHFTHFEKRAERISHDKYRIKIFYDRDDERELVIRVLSFGPFVKVTEPDEFVGLIRERLTKQKSYGISCIK